ncbi:MAG: phage major capsid protein [Eubacteriales bacterium]|nr:phage major capsid protein [Eubacteriales bacterium]
MTINEMRENITDLRNELNVAIKAGVALTKKEGVTYDELEKNNQQVSTLKAKLNTLTTALEDAEAAGKPKDTKVPAAGGDNDLSGKLKAMLKSSEYARTFSRAVKMGLKPSMACPSDSFTMLYDALTEIGGTVEGENGGFLVPEDADHQIHEVIRSLNPMRDLVTVEPTSTNKGTRVMDNAPTSGLTKLDGEMETLPEDDQPAFARVSYSLDTYGLLLPMSRELLSDEVANLFAYLARWFGKKQMMTENLLVKTMLNLLTSQNITPEDDKNAIAQVRSLLTLALDPAISGNAVIVTNQSGFDYLESVTDANGRPMLTQDPVTGNYVAFKTRPVKMFSDAQLPNRVVGGTGVYYPLYAGDFKQYGTLFERQGLEFASTDVGAGAFEKNGVTARGVTRLGTARFDAAAGVRREIFVAE